MTALWIALSFAIVAAMFTFCHLLMDRLVTGRWFSNRWWS